MAQVMPPSGAPAGQPQQGEEQGGNPQEAIQDIQEGFMQLGKLLQANQQSVDPQDMKLFESAVQATDAFIQSISGPAQPEAPSRAPQSGPMPPNANKGAKPSPNMG